MTDDVLFMPPYQTPAKAKKHTPCNGCGWCCHMEICPIGKHFFPDAVAPCPAMIFTDGIVRCGVVIAEQEVLKERPEQETIAKALGIGMGCDSDDVRPPLW